MVRHGLTGKQLSGKNETGVKYTLDYCGGINGTDYLIWKDGKRTALECKFNVQRDYEKADKFVLSIVNLGENDEVEGFCRLRIPFKQEPDDGVASGTMIWEICSNFPL
jgi:hypothetical protein